MTLSAPRTPSQATASSDLLSEALCAAIDRASQHLPLIVVEDDPEHVHQTRVGFRRAHAIVHAFRGVLEREWRRAVGAEIDELRAGLGPLRDADVTLARVAHHLEASDARTSAHSVLDELEDKRKKLRVRVVIRIKDEERPARVAVLAGNVRTPPLRKTVEEGDLSDVAARSWRKLHRAVERLGDDVTPKNLHRVRILTKRVRYVASAVVPVLGEGGPAFVDAAAHVQSLLGEMHDASVSARRLKRSGTNGDPGVKRLIELERDVVRRAVGAWPDGWTQLQDKARFR